MSLDKQIKEMATAELDRLTKKAHKAVSEALQGTPLGVQDVARLVSGHKTKTTETACVKTLSDKISADMLASLGNNDD